MRGRLPLVGAVAIFCAALAQASLVQPTAASADPGSRPSNSWWHGGATTTTTSAPPTTPTTTPPPTTTAPPPTATSVPPAVGGHPLTTVPWHPPATPGAGRSPGYWLAGTDGGVFTFGSARFAGSAAALGLQAPTVAVAATRSGRGYWIVTSDGGVFTFGDARFAGSAAGAPLSTPVVALIPTTTESGYWLVTSGGDILPFGDAPPLASPGPPSGGAPVVAAAGSAGGKGMWVADINGHVRAVGAAPTLSPLADGIPQSPRPLVGIAPSPSGLGFWTAYLDGTVVASGDAPSYGSLAGIPVAAPVAGIVSTGDGYYLVGTDGGVFAFGAAKFAGSAAAIHPATAIMGLAVPGSTSSAGAMLILGLLGQKTFSLTFDDGPNPTYTPLVLAVLTREHVLATFFEIGSAAERNPDLTAAVARAGNVVANHTFTHAYLTSLDQGAIDFQVDRTQQVVQALTGRAPSCFRPPYGATNASIAAHLAARGLHQEMWTVDPSDYRLPAPDAIAANVLANARPGGNVIFHDGGGDRSRTVAALPAIIDGLRAMGYTLVPVCD